MGFRAQVDNETSFVILFPTYLYRRRFLTLRVDTREKNDSKNFNQKALSNALVPKVSENVEKMMKVYDLTFEIGSQLFMKDLTFYLIENCKTVNEYTYRKE